MSCVDTPQQLVLQQDALLQTNLNNPIDPPVIGDLPSHQTGPLAELGPENPGIFQVTFTDADVRAIEDGLATFKELELDGQDVSKDNFPLPPNICAKLADAALEVHQGRGICQISGLRPAQYSDADNLLLFLAVANHIGDKRGIQDRAGNVISHITDAKSWTAPYEKRHTVHTNQNLAWHCDMGADILALQVRQIAKTGGTTSVASSRKIFNDILSERPAIIQVLSEPNWPVHISGNKSRYVLAPLLAFSDDKLMVNLDPSRLGKHPAMKPNSRGRNIPPLTEKQTEALSVIQDIAQRNRIDLATEPGDMIFINNWGLMHARAAYVDSDAAPGSGESDQRRHLVRLWLRNSELGWKIPQSLRTPWEAAYGYTDEGYVSGDHQVDIASQLKYAVVPDSEYKSAKYTTGSAAFAIDDSDSDEDGDTSGDNGEEGY